jgi:hypothetical protein
MFRHCAARQRHFSDCRGRPGRYHPHVSHAGADASRIYFLDGMHDEKGQPSNTATTDANGPEAHSRIIAAGISNEITTI